MSIELYYNAFSNGGFHFSNLQEFTQKRKALPVACEYEIEFIRGRDYQQTLVQRCGSVTLIFSAVETVEAWENQEMTDIFHDRLLQGYDLDVALIQTKQVVFYSDFDDYLEAVVFKGMGEGSIWVQYFDREAYERDTLLNRTLIKTDSGIYYTNPSIQH